MVAARKRKVNQANQEEGTLDDQTIRYVAKRSGNIRQTGVTQATNLQTQEVQGVSEEKCSRLPNMASTTWVKPRIVCHRDCNRDSDAQIECKGMSQQERPREDRREAKARDLSNACRPSQSKDTLDTRPQETATSREAVQQGKETMLHPMRKIGMEASPTLNKNWRIQQFNNS